ncbi:MAG: AAA family ATPase [candidate division Zixibacteria bacterium]|nr:AAA family ATPase [candidate division Zixibacteria bacterium]MBU1471187.1 AAA family ATPase [candidate division Zixibacteria bacterium]MBU2625768.1 AAA family ATPase [candidate division Zixibacteria bacterium]
MPTPNSAKELKPEQLRWRCDPGSLRYDNSKGVEPDDVIIGQERAVNAIKLGLEVHRQGYNIFISGLAGTGRTTTVKHLLETIDTLRGLPPDIVYLHNFKDADLPTAVLLPAGDGCRFKLAMIRLVDDLVQNITSLFESEKFQEHRKNIVRTFLAKQKEMLQAFEKEIAEHSFVLVQVQVGPYVKPDLHPVIDGKSLSFDELEVLVREEKVPEETLRKFEKKYGELESRLHEVFKENRDVVLKLEETLRQLEKKRTGPIVNELIKVLKSEFESESLHKYLDDVSEDVLKNISLFMKEKGSAKPEDQAGQRKREADPFLAYRVNVMVDNSKTTGPPIVVETNPNYRNLFGMIERESDGGRSFRTDFTRIKAGSLLKASGGYLVLNAIDALIEPGVWPALKRTLRNGQVEIQSYDPFHMLSGSALKPQPVDVDVKVLMIGDHQMYDLLFFADEDFKKIFKVLAQFDRDMKRDDHAVDEYVKFISKICDRDGLRPFDRSGIAGIVEYGVRIAGRQNKLTTRFNLISDLLREADYWAGKDSAEHVTYEHIRTAIENWKKRMNLPEERLGEMIDEGTIMIDTDKSVVGQINGLSVYDLGQYAFGKPTRITTTTAVGKSGVINIEREAELSGPTHNKGVLILSGFMRSRYANNKPLFVSASICFEQSYGGVDGDSASSTEIYALLSSLSGQPIRQDLAVTGSVNQKGEIQPIGGVNEKIEGFFEVCKARGLTGNQGVLIPHQNVKDLMLKPEVVGAVTNGEFHVYPVETIDQGIELLTGIPAGDPLEDGSYPEGTINRMVDDRLIEYAVIMKNYPGGA